MKVLKFFAAVCLLLFERFRGPKTVFEVKQPNQSLGGLKGFTVRGYEIAIYCHRRDYRIQYERWYIPNRMLVTYNVFSVVGIDAPVSLRKACELDVELPALVGGWSFDHEIRSTAVLAYLDMLEARMVSHSKK